MISARQTHNHIIFTRQNFGGRDDDSVSPGAGSCLNKCRRQCIENKRIILVPSDIEELALLGFMLA